MLLLASACGGRIENVAQPDATIVIEASPGEGGADSATDSATDTGFDGCSAPVPLIRACCGGKICNGTCDPKDSTRCTCKGIVGGCPPPTVCCSLRAGCVASDLC